VRVKVRLFASLRETVGQEELTLDVPQGATAEDVWRALVEEEPALASRRRSLMASVNRKYAPFDTPVAEGDEVVFIPPVSGG